MRHCCKSLHRSLLHAPTPFHTTYDSLNRIKVASETLTPTTGTAETWTQEFEYDRYGNRTFKESTTTTLPKECNGNTEVCAAIRPVVNPSVNPANNRLNGYTFDTAGNTTRDAQNRKFTYDAENKQVKVETLSGETVTGTVGEYWYDGDGKRIKKRGYTDNVLTEETIFLYDAAGNLIGEYSNQVASAQDAKVGYLTNDNLGSPRINTDLNGNIAARHDYHPFGEEIASLQRDQNRGYNADTVRKQFTGYERDNESSLDFAQARMYNPAHGRFTAVDPLLASGMPGNPQTWNRFIYVINNPLKFTDPDGLCPQPSVGPGQVGICVEAFIKAKKIDGIGDGDNRDHSSNSNDSARMRVVSVFTATETSIDESRRETLVSGSSVSVPVVDPHTGTVVDVGPPALPAGGNIDVSASSTAPQGTEGFGNGLTTSTTVNVELRNGANGFQVLGDNMQAAGATTAATGNPVIGAATNIAGRVVSAAAPDGTIDVSARIRITGSGDNIRVSGTAQSRPFPSVTGWAYIGMSDGSVRTVQLFRQDEARPRDLTKPMRPIR